MGRWRLSGTNWENRRWTASMPVVALADQLSAAFPQAHGADGTVASKAHDQASPSSDHRPRPFTGPGVVRAIDVGINSPAERGIPERLRILRDPRIKYVILDSRIFDDDTWTWRPYSGINPHSTHFHVSFNAFADEDGRTFDLGLDQQGGEEDMATPQEVWEFGILDQDDGVGTRGASHALKQTWKYSIQAATDAAIARKLVEQLALVTLTQAQIEAIADEVATELAERLAA